MTVHLPPPVMQQVEACALARYPEEACGLLVGRRGPDIVTVSRAQESRNIAANPLTSFEVDPGLRLRLQREVRDQGTEIVGVFHSHPSGDPRPSATDQAAIWEPDLVWLITAVKEGAVGESHIYAANDTDPPIFRRLELARA